MMRWKRVSKDPYRWRKWFAWYPVQVAYTGFGGYSTKDYAWLEWVERSGIMFYSYRPVEKLDKRP